MGPVLSVERQASPPLGATHFSSDVVSAKPFFEPALRAVPSCAKTDLNSRASLKTEMGRFARTDREPVLAWRPELDLPSGPLAEVSCLPLAHGPLAAAGCGAWQYS